MSDKENGGAAFPRDAATESKGMSLRDYFAAKAMQGLMTVYWGSQEEYEGGKNLVACQVESAYEYADAMLKERAK